MADASSSAASSDTSASEPDNKLGNAPRDVSSRADIERYAAIAGLALCVGGAWLLILAMNATIGIWPFNAAFQLARAQLAKNDPAWPGIPQEFTFRRHWGSFGGESTGWNISPRLVQLLVGLIMVLAGTSLLMRLLEPAAPPATVAKPESHAPVGPAKPASHAGSEAK